MRRILARIRSWFAHRSLDRDFESELASHLEMLAEDYQRRGMQADEAWRAARIRLGGMSQLREDHRATRGLPLVDTVWQDVRYAFRGFRRSPGLVATVVATIALGLGLDTALFTVFNATYLRPVGVRDSRSLYELSWIDRTGNGHGFSWNEYREVLAWNPAFSEAFGYRNADVHIDGHEVLGALVTGEYFQVLGIGSAIGRTLLPEDCSVPGRQPVIVLSYQSWQHRFSSDPSIIGKTVLLHGYPFEIVGVASAGFAGLGSRPSEFWVPLTMAPRFEPLPDLFSSSQSRSLSIVARLKPESAERQAQAGLTVWMQRLTDADPNPEKALRAQLLSRATTKPLNVRTALTFSPILAAFSLVLLIGCANVANLMLARALSRQREIGIRLSLGASRARLIRQLLTESILLALPSACGGILISEVTVRICVLVLLATLPPGVAGFAARIPQLHSDLPVFLFTLAIAVIASIAFGLAPAIQATRANVMQAAKGDFGDQLRPARLRNLLVAGQVATCVLLLVTAAVLLKGANRIHRLDAVLSSRNILQIDVREQSRDAVLNRLASDVSVETIAAAQFAPVERKSIVPVKAAGTSSNVAVNSVSPEYFALFEIPLIRGRAFAASEARSQAAVAVVSQAAADRLWPNQQAVGQTLELATESRSRQTLTVVGVVRDELSRWINNGDDRSLIYLPATTHASASRLLIGFHGDAESARRTVEAELTALDPEAVEQLQMIQIRAWVAEDAYYTFRIAYWLSSAIGVLALLLTLSGIYGVISYLVSQRTKEIGIRIAMGATSGAVTGLVLRESMRLAVAGAAAGCLLSLGVCRIAASMMVMIDAFDAVACFGGVALVLMVCAAAAYFPSRRASRIDPLATLRYD